MHGSSFSLFAEPWHSFSKAPILKSTSMPHFFYALSLNFLFGAFLLAAILLDLLAFVVLRHERGREKRAVQFLAFFGVREIALLLDVNVLQVVNLRLALLAPIR